MDLGENEQKTKSSLHRAKLAILKHHQRRHRQFNRRDGFGGSCSCSRHPSRQGPIGAKGCSQCWRASQRASSGRQRAGEPGCGCRLWSGVWRWTCQGGTDRITGRQGADDAAINRIGTRTLFPLRRRPRKETRHQRGSQYRSGGVVLMLIDGESPSPRRRGRETPQIPHFYPKPGSGHCLTVKRGVTKTSSNVNTGKHISSTQHAKRVATKNRWVFFIIYTNSLPSPLPSLSKPSKRITQELGSALSSSHPAQLGVKASPFGSSWPRLH